MADPLLAFRNIRAGYAASVVIEDVSFELPERGSLAVLGRNGVGKSTLLLTIMGYTQIDRGRVLWRGTDITRVSPHRRARAGIGWVAQEREIFPSLTVEENLTVAARAGRWDLAAVYALFPRLAERRRNFGNQLSGGEQQMLAIARALIRDAQVILLDEPLEGLAPLIVRDLVRVSRDLAAQGRTILVVEQNVVAALSFADRVYILNNGHMVWQGTPAALRADPSLMQAHLGI